MVVGVALAVQLPVVGHGVEVRGQRLGLGPLSHAAKGRPRQVGRGETIRSGFDADADPRGRTELCRRALGHAAFSIDGRQDASGSGAIKKQHERRVASGSRHSRGFSTPTIGPHPGFKVFSGALAAGYSQTNANLR